MDCGLVDALCDYSRPVFLFGTPRARYPRPRMDFRCIKSINCTMTNNRPSERAVDDERRVDLPPSLLSRSRPHPAR